MVENRFVLLIFLDLFKHFENNTSIQIHCTDNSTVDVVGT